MSKSRWLQVGLAAAWALFTGYALWSLPAVPFHPDESSYLYMSRDFDLLFRQGNPAAVTWTAANPSSDVRTYRLLDGPLTHYLPGLGRLFGGYATTIPHDWNWTASWNVNVAVGAMPAPGLLTAARWPAALLTALSLLPLYGIGRRVGGHATALGAVALYALSGLALLHGRRAMGEGPLLFFSLLTVWLLLRWPRQSLAWGGAAAFAVAAKLSALALLPVFGLAALWRPTDPAAIHTLQPSPTIRSRLLSVGLCAASFFALSWLLTPPLWAQPLGGLSAMLDARRQLVTNQTGALAAAAPGQVAGSLGQRLFAMLYHTYFAPPAFWDVPNYARQTAATEAAYLASPLLTGWHTTSLSTNLVAGSALLALTLAGVGFALHDLVGRHLAATDRLTAVERAALLVLLIWTGATILGLLAINITWQRYYLPLLPLACLWACYGLVKISEPFVHAAGQTR